MGRIAKLHKLNEQELQETIYPLTIPQAVIDPETQVALSDTLVEIKESISTVNNDLTSNVTTINENIEAVKTDLADNYTNTVKTNEALTSAINAHNEDESAHAVIQNAVSLADTKAEEAKTQANEAVDTAYEFSQVAAEAKTTAEAAKNAIATLEGLADADTSSITAAEIVTQVELNAANIQMLLDRDVVLTETAYSELTEKDVTKHYLIYEDPS